MRRFLILSFFLTLAGTPLFAQQSAPKDEVADRIIAVVGDSIILKSDVELEMLQLKQAGTPIADSAAVAKKILERRIGELVLLQAAVRDTSIKVTAQELAAEVQKEIDARRRQFGGETQFQQALTQAGMTMEDLRKQVEQDIGGRVLLREFVAKASHERKPPRVTDADIRKYFEENRASFGQRPALVTFAQLVIPPKASDSARAAARNRAEEALKRLRAGEDFETVAKQVSEDPSTREKGGDLGWFRSGQMVREFDDVTFALKPGETSSIVESPFGYHIIKVEKTRGAERQARHILFIPTVTPEDAEHMRTFANDIAQKIRNGASIDSLAKTLGDSNEQVHIGPFPKEKLPPPYNTALDSVAVGAVVGPLELVGSAGASKFAIVKIIDAKPAGEFSLDDASFRDDLRSTLEQNQVVDELIRDFRKRTLVEYRTGT